MVGKNLGLHLTGKVRLGIFFHGSLSVGKQSVGMEVGVFQGSLLRWDKDMAEIHAAVRLVA